MRVVCLAGGVGGAKLAEGLQQALAPGELTVIVNSGDDLERHSLTICPDQDTVMYTLAGIAGPEGWGLAGDTWQVIGALARLGEGTWFRLGDGDIATHLYRTERLRRGERPTEESPSRWGEHWASRRASCRWPTSRFGLWFERTAAGSTSRTTSSASSRRPTCARFVSRRRTLGRFTPEVAEAFRAA